VPTINLTAKGLRALRAPNDRRVDFWDETLPGFGVRVSPDGAKTWCVMYRIGRRKL